MVKTIRIRSSALAAISAAILLLSMAATVILALSIVGRAGAQEAGGPWNEPENLSLSAGTRDPVIAVDSSGRAHVIWNDSSPSFMYTRGERGAWSVAQSVELPFGTRRYYPDLQENRETPLHTPVLWAGQDDKIHAIWLDMDARLQYSNVPSADFSSFDEWSTRLEIAPSALAATAATDSSGQLHLVYIRPTTDVDSPAGIYYLGSMDGGETWSTPILLYESPYFRSLTAESANLQLTTTDGGVVVAAWDNPFQERVYIARSGDGGQTWEPPVEVDHRLEADGAGANGPHGIRLTSTGNDVHIVWQAGHGGLICAQFHQMSNDGAVTWQPAQRLMPLVETCSDSGELVNGIGPSIAYLAPTEEAGYITVWDGSQWSPAQQRVELTRFVNPLNYREVELACHQVATGASGSEGNQNTAIVLGCDTGPSGDIWALSVDLGLLLEQLAPEVTPVWQEPEIVTKPTAIESLQLLADADGWLHALWVQPSSNENHTTAVHYSRWDGLGWSQPKDLLRAPESDTADQPSIALGPENKIAAVWVDQVPGSIYFSQADLARAGIASEWSSPIALPVPEAEATSPEIAIGPDGVIHVVYAISLNEGRGIYLTQSADGGESWLDPVRVFDGVESGWSSVDSPRIAIGGDGTIHLLWTRLSLPPNSTLVSLHYSHSMDGGESWSEAEQVGESPRLWSDLLIGGDLAAHRIWMARNNDLWHQASVDAGASWGQPQRVSSSGELLGLAASILDGAGRPWLLQLAGTLSEAGQVGPPVELRSWLLSEGRWMSAEDLPLGTSEVEAFAAAAAGGDLNIVFSDIMRSLSAGQEELALYHSSRSLNLPQLEPTPLPTLTPTRLPEPTSSPTPAPLPTATTTFPTEAGQGSGLPIPINTSNPLTGPLLGIIPAAALVLIALFVGVRLLRGDRRR